MNPATPPASFLIPSHLPFAYVHAGNLIRQKNGILIPIDVFFEGLPAPPG